MKGFTPPSTLTLALAVLIAVTTATTAAAGLTALVRPANYKARMEAVRTALDYAEQVRAAPDASAYGPNAVCDRALSPAAATLHRDLATRAESSGLKVAALDVAPGAASDITAGLAPLDVSLAVEGSYDAALRLTAQLASGKPAVFVDRLELRRKAGGAVLKIEGRAFCWTSARP